MQIISDTQGVDFSSWLLRWHRETERTWDPLIPDEVNPPILKKGVVIIRFRVLPNGRLVEPTGSSSKGGPATRLWIEPRGVHSRVPTTRRSPTNSTAPTSSCGLLSFTTLNRRGKVSCFSGLGLRVLRTVTRTENCLSCGRVHGRLFGSNVCRRWADRAGASHAAAQCHPAPAALRTPALAASSAPDKGLMLAIISGRTRP